MLIMESCFWLSARSSFVVNLDTGNQQVLHPSFVRKESFHGFAFFFAVSFFFLHSLCAQESGQSLSQKILSREVITSPSRSFMVVGSNSVQNMDLAAWAEGFVGKISQVTGLKLPYGSSFMFRITVTDEHPEQPGKILTKEGMEEGEFVQRLNIVNYEKADMGEANEALCRMLLNGCVINCAGKSANNAEASSASRVQSCPAPQWLYRGMVQHIVPDLRAKNAEIVMSTWKKGRLKTLPEFLNSGSAEGGYPYDAVCGMMIAWFESFPDKSEFFGSMIRRLASGGELSAEWFSKNIKGCNSVSDIDEKWENWIIGQWRVVRRLGVVTPVLIEQMKEVIVLKPGDSGVPLSTNIGQRISFMDLIQAKDASWAPVVLQNKISELRFLGMGRGKDFGDVVESYCKFLEAVAEHRKTGRLIELLRVAESGLEALADRVSVEGSVSDDK